MNFNSLYLGVYNIKYLIIKNYTYVCICINCLNLSIQLI